MLRALLSRSFQYMSRFAIQKSFMANSQNHTPKWFVVDAEKEILGRMAGEIATILMGKNKPTYTPHVDCGDFVVVTNASKVQFTGKKLEKKLYRYHTGYIGGLREHNLEWMLEHKPEKVVELAVKRMVPKTKLGTAMMKKLKVYAGAEHQNQAQNPQPLSFAKN